MGARLAIESPVGRLVNTIGGAFMLLESIQAGEAPLELVLQIVRRLLYKNIRLRLCQGEKQRRENRRWLHHDPWRITRSEPQRG